MEVGLLLLACGHLVAATLVSAQDSTFLLTTDDPRHSPPTHLGNGRFSMGTSPHGTDATRSYLAGLYEHAPGDVPRIAALPAWNEVDLFNGSSWLNEADPSDTVLRSYRQTVDMYNGSVHTSYEWTDGARRTSVQVQAFVSRADPHLAAIRFRVVPH